MATRLVRRGVVATPDEIRESFALHAARNARKSRAGHAAISTDFRVGNGKSALAVTNADRTLGSKNYRLSASPAERAAHGARRTDNNAQYCAYDRTVETGGK